MNIYFLKDLVLWKKLIEEDVNQLRRILRSIFFKTKKIKKFDWIKRLNNFI